MQTNITQNKWLVRLGFLLFGSIAFLIFFYAAFPFHLVQEKMLRVFQTETGCHADSKDQAVLIPLRLRWYNVKIVCPSANPVTIASINADVALLPILLKKRGEIGFMIKIADQKGELSGTVIVDPTPDTIAFSLKNAGMGVHFNHRGFSGILDLKGEGRWVGQDILLGTGLFDFTLQEARLANQALPWPMNDILFNKISGKISWKDGVIWMRDIIADGENAALASQSGSLILHEPFSESFISIMLSVAPKGRLKQVAALLIPGYSAKEPLSLAITGALTSPKVLLNGRRLPTGS